MSSISVSAVPSLPRGVTRQAAKPRLRITARGRSVVATLIATPFALAVMLFSINGGAATASLDGATTSFEYVTVDAGESLWQLAESIAPTVDPRDVIAQIVQLNQLASSEVYAGQELALPPQYASSR